MISPGHLGPTQTPVQPKEQGLPGVSVAGGAGGGGATSCLAAIHSVILGMMGPLESGKGKEHERGLSVMMIVPDTVLTLGEFPIAVSEENTLPVLRLALLEVGEGGTARSGVAELLALVGTCQHHQ